MFTTQTVSSKRISRLRRWLVGATLLIVLIMVALAVFQASSPADRAKRLYRQLFSVKGGTGNLSSDVDRIETRIVVEALSSLLDDCTSALGDRYGEVYAKLPTEIKNRLPTPLDRAV